MRSATERELAPAVRCAHDICDSPAIVRIKLDTGLANLCRTHYDSHAQRAADAFCRSQQLETTEQKQTWLKDKLQDIKERITGPAREPGSDDE